MNLSKEAFVRAKRFIETHARPLEAARFKYHFEGGKPEEVVDQLRPFQNADGGFGHALEPDLRTTSSSALCTTVAFQVLREVGITTTSKLIQDAVDFLLETYNSDLRSWQIVPPSCDDAPHAPWWTQKGKDESFDRFSLNPAAEILGYLIDHREAVDSILISDLIELVLESLSNADRIEMHDLLCVKRLAETDRLEGEIKEQAFQHLARLLDTAVVHNPSQWGNYGLRPLQVADHPQSPFFPQLKDAIESNLDYEIQRQEEDGSWKPNWSWGEDFPQDWERARIEWSGMLTLEKILLLKRYGRIEG